MGVWTVSPMGQSADWNPDCETNGRRGPERVGEVMLMGLHMGDYMGLSLGTNRDTT